MVEGDEDASVEEQREEEEEESWEKALSVERFGDIISDSASTSGDRMGRHYTEKDFESKQSILVLCMTFQTWCCASTVLKDCKFFSVSKLHPNPKVSFCDWNCTVTRKKASDSLGINSSLHSFSDLHLNHILSLLIIRSNC